jgi:excisionase family DNA binding protein
MNPNGTSAHSGTNQIINEAPLMTVPEAAMKTGISPRAIRRALVERRLEGMQVGTRWLVDAEDLERYAPGAKMRQAHGADGAPAPNPIGTDGAAIVEELRQVIDRAVGAEVRAQIAEKTIATMQEERDAALARALHAEARVIELQNAAQEKAGRKWWHFGASRAA